MPNNYDVGYGKPPIETQFQKGQSGNPKGRPKGSRNFTTDLKEVAEELITVREGGHEKKMTKQEALIRTQFTKALQGEDRASAMVVQLITRYLQEDQPLETQEELSLRDEETLEWFIASIKEEGNDGKDND